MRFHVLTLFPDMVKDCLETSILGRAQEKGCVSFHTVNIRDFTEDKHKKVDDYTYGGGAGMLMQAQPVYDAWKSVREKAFSDCSERKRIRTIYVTPQGIPFTQKLARELASEEELILLCGHYEGIDERVLEETVTDYVSIGDYVLTGGELPAMVIIDAVSRLVPGVLHNEESAETESFHNNLLEYPQYSRPEVWHGKRVPDVLLSGDHKKIEEWRLKQSRERTRERRPDLYLTYEKDQGAISNLYRQKLLHTDMIQVLGRGTGKLLHMDEDGCAVRDLMTGTIFLTAEEHTAKPLLSHIQNAVTENLERGKLLAVHQAELAAAVREKYDGYCFTEQICRLFVYTKDVPLKPAHHIVFRELTENDLPVVAEHYHDDVVDDIAYLKDRLRKKSMLGAFLEEKLVGFIGMHGEGSIGLLHVLSDWRRKGVGAALEAEMINRLLREGRTPYCYVREENEASAGLQEKLGLYPAKGRVHWLCGSRR